MTIKKLSSILDRIPSATVKEERKNYNLTAIELNILYNKVQLITYNL